jgi:hypothetical protein
MSWLHCLIRKTGTNFVNVCGLVTECLVFSLQLDQTMRVSVINAENKIKILLINEYNTQTSVLIINANKAVYLHFH